MVNRKLSNKWAIEFGRECYHDIFDSDYSFKNMDAFHYVHGQKKKPASEESEKPVRWHLIMYMVRSSRLLKMKSPLHQPKRLHALLTGFKLLCQYRNCIFGSFFTGAYLPQKLDLLPTLERERNSIQKHVLSY
jgi:hypothetical protein